MISGVNDSLFEQASHPRHDLFDKHCPSVMIVSTCWVVVRAVEHPARGRHNPDTKMATYHTSAFYSPIANTSKKKKNCPEKPAIQVKGKKYRRGCGHATPNAHFPDLFLSFSGS